MGKFFKFINKILGIGDNNEGYIGLTSFRPEVVKEEINQEPEILVAKTSLTGMLKRAS